MWKYALAALLILNTPVLGQPLEVIEGTPIVFDGDTLLFGDARVKLLGVNAPEMSDWPIGVYARTALDELVISGGLHVVCTVVLTGSFRQKVSQCLTNIKGQSVSLGAAMVALGWAVPDRLFPSRESDLQNQFKEGQRDARKNHRGIWATPIVPPAVQ